MPIKRYDKHFGGEAEKTLARLKARYGERKGRSVFYAMVNKRKKGQ